MEMPEPGPAVQLTLTTEFSRRGLLELRGRIDELLRDLAPGADAGRDGRSEQERAELKIRDLWERLGETSRRYLMTAAQASVDDEFVLDHIASRMSVDVQKVKAYHRNVARSAGQVAPEQVVFDSRRDGSRTRLRMPPHIRAAVLAINKEDL